MFVSGRRRRRVLVVEDHGHGGLGDPGLALLVDELLQRVGAHGREVADAEHEADGVEDVGLARAVEARDGVEEAVEAVDVDAGGVRLEAVDVDGLDVHLDWFEGGGGNEGASSFFFSSRCFDDDDDGGEKEFFSLLEM